MIRAIPLAIILCVLWAGAWIAVDAAKPSPWGEWYDSGIEPGGQTGFVNPDGSWPCDPSARGEGSDGLPVAALARVAGRTEHHVVAVAPASKLAAPRTRDVDHRDARLPVHVTDCIPCYTEDNSHKRGWSGDLDGEFSVDLPYPLCPFGNAALAVRLTTPRRFSPTIYATHESGMVVQVPKVSTGRHALCFPRPPYPAGMWTVTLSGPVKDAYLEVVVMPWPRIAQGWCQ